MEKEVGSLIPNIIVVVGGQSSDLVITTDRFNPSESTFIGRRNSYLCLEVLPSSPVGLRLEVRPRGCDDLVLPGGARGRSASITPRMEGRSGERTPEVPH